MDTIEREQEFEPLRANRKAFLLLRWLIIILAGYLTLFENIEDEGVVSIFLIVVAFVLSNVLIALAPLRLVMIAKQKRIVSAVDAIFICTLLYYLRIEQAQIHLPFMGVIVLAIIWPDLRVVLFALFIVSLLFGLFTNLELFDAAIEIARDDFLTMSLLFVVSIFYIFMVDRFDQDAKTSAALLREKRNSESVAAITRTISTSLEPKQILAVVIKRFRELMPDVEASILKLDLGTNEASVVAGARGDGAETVRFKDLPTLEEAYTLKETSASSRTRNGSGKASMAVPMISRDEIVAMMYFEGDQSQAEAMNDNRGFVEVVASTAAGALANAEQFENMKELATSDSMTRLANHATFQTRLTHEVERARRHNRTVSLMMVDLDHLKRINDEYGHPMGDRVIAGIAEAIRVSCREIDFGARYGGEEFAVILPETDLKSGVLVAERLRHRIADIDQFGMQVSVSIGVANCPLDAGTADELILAADNALYAAKGGGRNRVSPSPSDV